MPIDLSGIPTDRLKPGGAALIAACDEVLRVPDDFDKRLTATAVAYSGGKLILLYCDRYTTLPVKQQVELLEHEAQHVVLDFFMGARGLQVTGASKCPNCRLDDKDTYICDEHQAQVTVWNIAHDCAINHGLDRASLPTEGSFYDVLGLPVAPPEVTYALLQQRLPPKKTWCTPHRRLGKLVMDKIGAITRIAAGLAQTAGPSGKGSGSGGVVDVLPYVERPKWLDKLEACLQTMTKQMRRRTWMRDSRRPVYVRGRRRQHKLEKTGLVLLDVSGSMWSDLPMLLAVVIQYLPHCEGAVWDTVASSRMPARDLLSATETVGGGGTDPRCASALRRPGEPTIWISDCEVVAWPRMSDQDTVIATGRASPPLGARVIRTLDTEPEF